MNYQIINDDYYNQILDKIGEHFPSFHSVFDEEDGTYLILAELGRYIIENFSTDFVKNSSLNFINEAIEQGGSETQDIIVLQLFQKFYEDPAFSDQIRKLLNANAASIFDEYFEEHNK